jgi:hypothetical protein
MKIGEIRIPSSPYGYIELKDLDITLEELGKLIEILTAFNIATGLKGPSYPGTIGTPINPPTSTHIP